jgi:large-conductance mechanosensitive channel
LPIVNFFVAGANDGNGLITVLRAVYKADADGKQVIDLDNSIYIDWGTFIDKVIDFILIALVLFIIIRIFMSLQNLRKDFTSADAKKARKLTKKYMKEEGLGYEAAKKKAEDEIVAEKAASAEPAAPAAPTQEELLAEIRDLLKQNNSSDKN